MLLHDICDSQKTGNVTTWFIGEAVIPLSVLIKRPTRLLLLSDQAGNVVLSHTYDITRDLDGVTPLTSNSRTLQARKPLDSRTVIHQIAGPNPNPEPEPASHARA